jgi:hypothetical protein
MEEHARISKKQKEEASKRQTKHPSERKKVESQTKGKY